MDRQNPLSLSAVGGFCLTTLRKTTFNEKTTSEKTETNTYNAVNQLVGFTDGETTASYAYNASGLRYEKTVDGETVHHVWDGNQQIVADVVESQFYEANCYIRGTNLAATYHYQNGAKSDYTYYVQNAHGDVVNLTDADGAVTKTYHYDAFGVEQDIADSDENAFRYCGEYFDAETGTIYLRARYYNPATGRFTQRDSYAGKNGEPLSLNLYTYCHNNPILYLDTNGHWVHLAIGAVVGGVIGGVSAAISSYAEEGNINWKNVAISTATGALTGAVAASGAGLLAQGAVNIVASGIESAASQYVNLDKNKGEKMDWIQVGADAVVGGVFALVGGKGAANGLSDAAKDSMKRTTKGFTSMIGKQFSNWNNGKQGLLTTVKKCGNIFINNYYKNPTVSSVINKAFLKEEASQALSGIENSVVSTMIGSNLSALVGNIKNSYVNSKKKSSNVVSQTYLSAA